MRLIKKIKSIKGEDIFIHFLEWFYSFPELFIIVFFAINILRVSNVNIMSYMMAYIVLAFSLIICCIVYLYKKSRQFKYYSSDFKIIFAISNIPLACMIIFILTPAEKIDMSFYFNMFITFGGGIFFIFDGISDFSYLLENFRYYNNITNFTITRKNVVCHTKKNYRKQILDTLMSRYIIARTITSLYYCAILYVIKYFIFFSGLLIKNPTLDTINYIYLIITSICVGMGIYWVFYAGGLVQLFIVSRKSMKKVIFNIEKYEQDTLYPTWNTLIKSSKNKEFYIETKIPLLLALSYHFIILIFSKIGINYFINILMIFSIIGVFIAWYCLKCIGNLIFKFKKFQ